MTVQPSLLRETPANATSPVSTGLPLKVLRGDQPASSLRKFRGKKIDGHELASRAERFLETAEGGGFDHLESLYVLPETGE